MHNNPHYKENKELDFIIESIKEINQLETSQASHIYEEEDFGIYLPIGKHYSEE